MYVDLAVRAEEVDFFGYRSPAPANYLAASGFTSLFSIRPSLRFDNRNNPLMATKGQYVEISAEQGFGSFTWTKFDAEGRMYIPTFSRPDGSGKQFFTLRGKFGIATESTPVYERYFAGNFGSLRGFQYRTVSPHAFDVPTGGVMMAVGSVEYQFPWNARDTFNQIIFTDFGTVTGNYELNAPRVSVGTGLKVMIPAFGPMPFEFDLAFPVLKQIGDRVQFFNFTVGGFTEPWYATRVSGLWTGRPRSAWCRVARCQQASISLSLDVIADREARPRAPAAALCGERARDPNNDGRLNDSLLPGPGRDGDVAADGRFRARVFRRRRGGRAGSRGLHVLLSIATVVALLGIHSIVYTYFVATGKWAKEVVTVYQLPEWFNTQAKKNKRRAFRFVIWSMTTIAVAAWLGAAADTISTSYSIWHLGSAALALAFNLGAFVVEYAVIVVQVRLLTELKDRADRLREARYGLDPKELGVRS